MDPRFTQSDLSDNWNNIEEAQYNMPPSTQQLQQSLQQQQQHQQQQQQQPQQQPQQQQQNYRNFNQSSEQKRMRSFTPRFTENANNSTQMRMQMFSGLDPYLEGNSAYQDMMYRPVGRNSELSDAMMQMSPIEYQANQYASTASMYNQMKAFNSNSTSAVYSMSQQRKPNNQAGSMNTINNMFQGSQFFEMQQQEQQHQQQMQRIINANQSSDTLQKNLPSPMQQQQQVSPNPALAQRCSNHVSPSSYQHIPQSAPSPMLNTPSMQQDNTARQPGIQQPQQSEQKTLPVIVPKETIGFMDFLEKFSDQNQEGSESVAADLMEDNADIGAKKDESPSSPAVSSTIGSTDIPKVILKGEKEVASSRYQNTMHALEKAGLLDITLQTAELINKSSVLQKDIDMLEEIVKVTKHLMGET